MSTLEPPNIEPPESPPSPLEADRAGRGVRTVIWAVLGAALIAALAYGIFG